MAQVLWLSSGAAVGTNLVAPRAMVVDRPPTPKNHKGKGGGGGKDGSPRSPRPPSKPSTLGVAVLADFHTMAGTVARAAARAADARGGGMGAVPLPSPSPRPNVKAKRRWGFGSGLSSSAKAAQQLTSGLRPSLPVTLICSRALNALPWEHALPNHWDTYVEEEGGDGGALVVGGGGGVRGGVRRE